MLFTHDEARQMYCPFKLSQPESREAGQVNPKWTCEASKCMAWQTRVIPAQGEGGYCGLAGKPEMGI
jgi:hypothetical protein